MAKLEGAALAKFITVLKEFLDFHEKVDKRLRNQRVTDLLPKLDLSKRPDFESRSQSFANCFVLSLFLGNFARFCCAVFIEVIEKVLRGTEFRVFDRARFVHCGHRYIIWGFYFKR